MSAQPMNRLIAAKGPVARPRMEGSPPSIRTASAACSPASAAMAPLPPIQSGGEHVVNRATPTASGSHLPCRSAGNLGSNHKRCQHTITGCHQEAGARRPLASKAADAAQHACNCPVPLWQPEVSVRGRRSSPPRTPSPGAVQARRCCSLTSTPCRKAAFLSPRMLPPIPESYLSCPTEKLLLANCPQEWASFAEERAWQGAAGRSAEPGKAACNCRPTGLARHR